MTESDSKYSSLKREIAVLKQKVEVLENLNKQNKTKYQEVQLKLTHQYKEKEELLTDEIEELKDQLDTQKQGLKLLQIDSLSHQSFENQNLLEQNEQYQDNIKSLKHQLTDQKTKITKLEKEISDLKMINKTYKKQVNDQNTEIKSLKQTLEMQLQSSMNIQPMSRHQSGTPLKISSKMPSVSNLHTAPKRTISRNISKTGFMFRKQGTVSATMETRAQFYTLGATPIPLQQTTTDESMYDGDLSDIETTKLTLKPYSTEKGAGNDEKVLEIVEENDYDITEYKTVGGKLIIKQEPIDVTTHIWMNLFVELNKQKMCIGIYLNKNCSVDLLIMLLQKSMEIPDICGNDVDINVYCGNDDGELDDEYSDSGLDNSKSVGSLGIMNMYIKVGANADIVSGVSKDRNNRCSCVVL